MTTDRVSSDILAAILGLMPDDPNARETRFTGESERIHTILERVQRHYSVLDSFNFTQDDLFPFSKELEDSLAILQRSRMIKMENPDFIEYVVPTSTKRLVEREVIEMFDDSERQELKELASIFAAECGTSISSGQPTA